MDLPGETMITLHLVSRCTHLIPLQQMTVDLEKIGGLLLTVSGVRERNVFF